MKPVEVGDQAPDFTARTADGREISLADFRDRQALVLFFYPRDNSPICTQEVCGFRDAYQDLLELGAAVIGVSGDSADSHRSFAASQRLPYDLIPDENGALRKLFGVPKSLFVLPGRVTYVIDRQGIVRLKYDSQLLASSHVKEAMQTLRNLATTGNSSSRSGTP